MCVISNLLEMKTMKPLVVILFMLSSSLCFSQGNKESFKLPSRKTFISSLSFDIGPSLCFMYGGAEEDLNTVDSKDPLIGYSIGVGLVHSFEASFDIRASLLYERKGGIINHEGSYFDQQTGTMQEGESSDEYKYDCYTFPLQARFRAGIFTFGLGPYVSYLKKQVKVTTFSFTSSSVADESYLNRNFDFGASISISCDVPLNSKFSISSTIQNNLGLVQTRNISYVNDGTIKLNNTAILIGIIYKR
jgi:hypothetical protein